MARIEADEAGGRVLIRTQYRERDLVKQVPGATWDRDADAWTAPLSWGVAWGIRGVFGDTAEVDPSFTDWVRRRWETREAWLDWARQQTDMDDIAGLGETWEALEPLQRVGAAFMAAAGRAMNLDGMGSGKTVQAIVALRARHARGHEVLPLLIVAPNSMKYVWRTELGRWWPEVRVAVAGRNAGERRAAIAEVAEGEADALVINWESLRLHTRLAGYGSIRLRRCGDCGGPGDCAACGGGDKECEACGGRRRVTPASCETHEKELNGVDWAAIVADESHRMKDHTSKQTRAMWWLGQQGGPGQTRLALTGTPVESSPDDAWPQLHWVSPEDWPRRTQFIDRYCERGWTPYGMEITGLSANGRNEFYQVFDRMHVRRPKEAVLPYLPEKAPPQVRWLEMEGKQAKAYRQMEEHMVAELDGGLAVALNPLTVHARLSQLASSWAEVDEEGNVSMALPSNKVDALVELAEEMAGRPFVVFAESRQLIDLADAALEKVGLRVGRVTGAEGAMERESHVQAFQAGDRDVMLCTFGAGSEGITLTRADTIVFMQRAWSSIQNQQAEDRVHRRGSERHERVHVIELRSLGTVDERRAEAWGEKADRQQEVLRDDEVVRRLLGVA